MKEGFGELYTRLYNENIEELEALRAKNKKTYTIIFIIIGIIIVSIFFMGRTILMLMPFLMPILIGIMVICIIKGTKKSRKVNDYTRIFKQKIVTPLINNVFDNGVYEPDKGWSVYEYKKGEYRDNIDRYSSEDMITATVKGADGIENTIQFAEVHTERRTRDSDGDVHYYTEFYGLAGKLALKKDISTKIYIKNNGSVWLDKNKVKMDMSEFEKIFDVTAEDKILAVRILTADVMAEMIELYRKFKYRNEIHIINNTIYMRLATGNMFEPNIFKNALDYKTVEKYYLVLQAMMNISTHIYDIINEIEL